MSQDSQKRLVASAAADYVVETLPEGGIVGVGTGSTANLFIDALAERRLARPELFRGAVSSSEASSARLRAHGIAVLELNDVDDLPLYVDGADEINDHGHMIKGGGGALTREKIVASVAREMVCIVDASKLVATLGAFPLPVEVIPMARQAVARQLAKLGGDARLRRKSDGTIYLTDNGCEILDTHGLSIGDPVTLETTINQIPGVLSVGLFALRGANLLIIGAAEGVQRRRFGVTG